MESGRINRQGTFANLAADKQRAVLAAATKEFARQGYSRASVNVIVREAGISKGSLYQYFANKEALFSFVFSGFRQKVKEMVKSLAAQGDFFILIGQVLRAGVTFVDRYPDYFQIYLKILFDEDVPGREELLGQVRLFSVDYFGDLCQMAQRKGLLRGDVALESLIFLLDAAIDRFLQDYARGDVADPEGPIDDLTKMLHQAMAVGRR
ncbi:MAG: TetR/AcrR family transcriptional regulator [Thermodesulfobacteriota bacterium]